MRFQVGSRRFGSIDRASRGLGLLGYRRALGWWDGGRRALVEDEAVGQDEAGQSGQPDQPDRSAASRPPRRTDDHPPWLGLALGLAILVAPFLALLYGIEAGLVVMSMALAAVGLLAVLAARSAEPDLRQRLLLVSSVNLVLALICLLVLLART
jgi:hypothetical protein